MKVALIGATGFVGKALVNELLNRGHEVIAIARNPEKLPLQHPALSAKAGNAHDAQQVADLVKGADAVVSAYNSGWANPRIYEDFMEGSKAIQEGVKRAGVKRLVVIGGAGSLEIKPGLQLIDTPQFPAEYKQGAMGARDYLNLLKKETELEWSFFSPAIMMNHTTAGVRRGTYRLGLDNPVFDSEGKSVLSVEDLAMAIVDELEQPKHIKKRFTAAY